MELPYLYSTATNKKKLLVKVRSLPSVPKAMKNKFRLVHYISRSKTFAKAKIAQNNSQVFEGEITVKPDQDSIHELTIKKVNPSVTSVNLYPVSNCIQLIGEFLTATF